MKRTHRKPSVGVIGAGAVGRALAIALDRTGYDVVSVVDRTRTKARRLASHLRQCGAYSSVSDLPFIPSLLILALPEEQIAQTVAELRSSSKASFVKTTILHVSGSLTSDVLSSLAERGAFVGSLHPIVSFPRRIGSVRLAERLKGATYGFEGSRSAERIARTLVRRLKGRCICVPKEEKILYHIACVLFSNYAVVLVGAGAGLTKRLTGFRPGDFRRLMEESIGTAFERGAGSALTGPVARGSLETIHAHRNVLRRKAPAANELYRVMGAMAVDLAASMRRLKPAQIARMRKIFRTK